MRKAALAVLAALVVVAGVVIGIVLYRMHAARDVRGSSTVEFVPSEIPKVRPPTRSAIVWPTFGFDNARLHVGPALHLRPPFRVAWVAGGRSLLEFPPAIAYERLYLANGSGSVFALNTRTGRRAWSYNSNRCEAASPTVTSYAGGTVYETFLNKRPCSGKRASDGEIVALTAGTGQVRWRRHIGASETSPLVAAGRVYVGDWLGKIYALDARTGRVRWTFQTSGEVKGALAYAGKRVFVGSYDGQVYALNASTGKLIWKAGEDPRLFGRGRFYSTPAVAYGRVFIGSTDGKVYSFGAHSGRRRWSQSTGGYVYGSPAVWKQRVFVGSYDQVFYAFDAATGDVVWKFKANGPISGSAVVIDGVVYFSTLKARTYALAAKSGHVLWSFHDGKYAAVVADKKRLYLLGFAKVYGLVPR